MGIIPAGAGKRPTGWRSPSRRGDHPRGCGEKWRESRRAANLEGSSPRVRGKVIGLTFAIAYARIIPAGAGKSFRRRRGGRGRGDHPRGCGEKVPWTQDVLRHSGSSPRVRGKAPRRQNRMHPAGIIPAGAGKSVEHGGDGNVGPDHPRGCGEKQHRRSPAARATGSSPRVRGKGVELVREAGWRGIIPAGAGKRRGDDRRRQEPQDHPRGCGEKGGGNGRGAASLGSSPRVRGKDTTPETDTAAVRIIPAGAGKRACRVSPSPAVWDHPRGCGEKEAGLWGRRIVSGSSPRVRGKAKTRQASRPGAGIIPAGAGKRGFAGPRPRLRGDHPRGCGEKRAWWRRGRTTRGSSPRVRGKATHDAQALNSLRIIPAGAGKSSRIC